MARKRVSPAKRVTGWNKYHREYVKEHYTSINIKFSNEKDSEMLDLIDRQPNKKLAIANLIQKAIAEEKSQNK